MFYSTKRFLMELVDYVMKVSRYGEEGGVMVGGGGQWVYKVGSEVRAWHPPSDMGSCNRHTPPQ